MAKDYLKDFQASKDASIQIQNFWHRQGFTKVRAWVEPSMIGTNNRKIWVIRSNIVFGNPNTL